MLRDAFENLIFFNSANKYFNPKFNLNVKIHHIVWCELSVCHNMGIKERHDAVELGTIMCTHFTGNFESVSNSKITFPRLYL